MIRYATQTGIRRHHAPKAYKIHGSSMGRQGWRDGFWLAVGAAVGRSELGHPPVAGRGGASFVKTSQGHMRLRAVAVAPPTWAKVVLPRPPERKTRARNSFPADIGNLEPRHFIQTCLYSVDLALRDQGCIVCKTGPKRKGCLLRSVIGRRRSGDALHMARATHLRWVPH